MRTAGGRGRVWCARPHRRILLELRRRARVSSLPVPDVPDRPCISALVVHKWVDALRDLHSS